MHIIVKHEDDMYIISEKKENNLEGPYEQGKKLRSGLRQVE
jgi:hypothetical protein